MTAVIIASSGSQIDKSDVKAMDGRVYLVKCSVLLVPAVLQPVIR